MTTKVLIANYGPDAIAVHIGGKTEYVYPQKSGEFYVHANQMLSVEESPILNKTGALDPALDPGKVI